MGFTPQNGKQQKLQRPYFPVVGRVKLFHATSQLEEAQQQQREQQTPFLLQGTSRSWTSGDDLAMEPWNVGSRCLGAQCPTDGSHMVFSSTPQCCIVAVSPLHCLSKSNGCGFRRKNKGVNLALYRCKTLQQGQDFRGLLEKSCQLIQTDYTLPLRPFSARLVDWPCKQSMVWEDNSFPWTFILWNVPTDYILAWSSLVKETFAFTSFWLRQSCLTPNLCVNLHFYSFFLCTHRWKCQLGLEAQLNPTIGGSSVHGLVLRKLTLRIALSLKHLVKFYVQLPSYVVFNSYEVVSFILPSVVRKDACSFHPKVQN